VSARAAAEAAGLLDIEVTRETDAEGKGRAKNIVRLAGRPDPSARYTVESIDVTRTRSKPYPPFITSTLQQAASSRLGMSTDRTMRIAQQLYEETAESLVAREAERERRRLFSEPAHAIEGRPTKRDRRAIERARGEG
jgi:DNA topoisomerase IA